MTRLHRSLRGTAAGHIATGQLAIEPELASFATSPPEGDGWLHEIKLDGYRILAFVHGEHVQLRTRSGRSWTTHAPGVVAALRAMRLTNTVLDGEVVALRASGQSDFQRLQNAIKGPSAHALVYIAFDALIVDGRDLRDEPIERRKEVVAEIVARAKSDRVRLGEHLVGSGGELFRRACELGLEGIVSKRAGSRYRGGRGRDWLKIKCAKRQEVVVVGYSDPAGARLYFGALLVAVQQGETLRYAGKVGTGFSDAMLGTMYRQLRSLEVPAAPVVNPPRGAKRRGVHWVEPKLVADVSFSEWTDDGQLRQPCFLGFRETKRAPGPAVDDATPGPVSSRKSARPRARE